MAGSMEGKFLAEALKGNALNLEEANKKIENSTNPKEKEKAFERAEKIETELNKIEEMMGIDAEEMLSLYKTITPDDAKSIVTMTIAKIPASLMKGVLFTVDNLRQNGGKIMLVASKLFPREAALIAASVMILILGSGIAQDAMADDAGSLETVQMSAGNPSDKTANPNDSFLEELETVSVPKGTNPVLNGELMMPEDTGADQNHRKTLSDVRSGDEVVQELEENTYGNRHSINRPEDGVSMGIFRDN